MEDGEQSEIDPKMQTMMNEALERWKKVIFHLNDGEFREEFEDEFKENHEEDSKKSKKEKKQKRKKLFKSQSNVAESAQVVSDVVPKIMFGAMETLKSYIAYLLNSLFQRAMEPEEGEAKKYEPGVVSDGEKALAWLLTVMGKVAFIDTSMKKLEVELEDKDVPEKIVVNSKEEVKKILEELKQDCVIVYGNDWSSVGLVIENGTRSQLCHVQFLHYERKTKKYVVVESSLDEQFGINGVAKTAFEKRFWPGNEMLNWVYILKIDWKKLRKSKFQELAYPWIESIVNNQIPYDIVNIFQDDIAIVLTRMFQDGEGVFGFMKDFCEHMIKSVSEIQKFDQLGLFEKLSAGLIDSLKRAKEVVVQKNDFKAFVCSEFVGFILRFGGVLKEEVNVSPFTPQTIVELKIFEKYYVMNYEKDDEEKSPKFKTHNLRNFNTVGKYVRYITSNSSGKEKEKEGGDSSGNGHHHHHHHHKRRCKNQ